MAPFLPRRSISRPRPRRLRGLSSAAGLALLCAGPAAGAAPPSPFDLEEATIADLQARMTAGRESARSLAVKYLARIKALDRNGPALRSVIERNPEALAIADLLDAERRTRGPRGPLHGIPVLIKDNIATADRMSTSAGSLALDGAGAARDAFVVRRLRAAGAVLLGKTNLSEWANFRSTASTSGWSARGGLTKNPYALDRNPSGSSSGSAVAAAANLCAVAVGTETDGSIVSPASVNGIVGIKPTLGLVSRSGIVPIAHSQDSAGPMARTVTDAALLLAALAGADPDDAATAPAATHGADYQKALDPEGLRGARLGVVRNKLFGSSRAADRVAEQAIEEIRGRGATLIDVELPPPGQFEDSELEVLLYEFKTDLDAYLGQLGPTAKVHSLADLVAFNQAHAEAEMPFFGQELLLLAQKKGPLSDPKYRQALARGRRLARERGIDAVLARHHLDALLAPTGSPAWVTDLVDGDHGGGGPATIAAVAGYPHITVPAGFAFGLPVGISFIGRAWDEPRLLRLAYAYEQATRQRRPPRLLRSAVLRLPGG